MSDINGIPQTAARQRRDYFTKRQSLLVAGSTVVAAALGVGGVFAVQDAVAAHSPATVQYSGQGDPFGSGAYGGSSGAGAGASAPSASVSGAAASSTQSKGVALIETQLGYQSAEAAGTGIVLSSRGEILTNNHVIEGSTAIRVLAGGKVYTATVVGDDPRDDVAVLQLQGATGLATAAIDSAHTVSVGDAITGVGNAQGGGTLVAAAGTVTGLDKSITTQADGSASESLHGLIETDAGIQPGDSGGPLFDAAGKVIGIDTAAASSGAADGYAIPITTAVSIAKQIESGRATGNVEIGYPAFLGVELGQADASSGFAGSGFGSAGTAATGAPIAGVVSGGPAESAGLVAGDTITAVGGAPITSTTELQTALAARHPGDRVAISWVDASGQSHTATVTLAQGPAA